MNRAELIGRLVRDPELRYTSGSQMAVCTFTIAVDRPTKAGEEKKADFLRIKTFGKWAETCDRYLKKGKIVGVQGRIETGSYTDKNGNTVYTTDIIADNNIDGVTFMSYEPVQNQQPKPEPKPEPQEEPKPEPTQESFEAIDEEIPF